MGNVRVRIHAQGLLNYAQTGREALGQVKRAIEHVLSVGATDARNSIRSQFRVRTGRLLMESARGMKKKVTLDGYRSLGRVAPLPHLMNIFEGGATLPARTITPKSAQVLAMPTSSGEVYFGRSADIPSVTLRPRPVILPASQSMERAAPEIFERILRHLGHS